MIQTNNSTHCNFLLPFLEVNRYLVLEKANKRVAVEFKVSTSPTVSKGFYNALQDIEATEAWTIAPIKEMYPMKKDIWAAPLWKIIHNLQNQ